MSSAMFAHCGSEMLRKLPDGSDFTAHRRFRGVFGVSPDVCASVWTILGTAMPYGATPKHLLWSLFFLKCYATEHVNATVAGTDEKTFRKWAWTFVGLISNLRIVSSLFFVKSLSLTGNAEIIHKLIFFWTMCRFRGRNVYSRAPWKIAGYPWTGQIFVYLSLSHLTGNGFHINLRALVSDMKLALA